VLRVQREVRVWLLREGAAVGVLRLRFLKLGSRLGPAEVLRSCLLGLFLLLLPLCLPLLLLLPAVGVRPLLQLLLAVLGLSLQSL